MDKHSDLRLIGFLTVVVALGILVAIVIPSYSSYARKVELRKTFSSLLALNGEERFYWSRARNYGPSDCAVGAIPPGTKYFMFACILNNSGQGYLITAKGQGTLLNYSFTIDQAGNMVTIEFPGVSGLPLGCWLDAPGPC